MLFRFIQSIILIAFTTLFKKKNFNKFLNAFLSISITAIFQTIILQSVLGLSNTFSSAQYVKESVLNGLIVLAGSLIYVVLLLNLFLNIIIFSILAPLLVSFTNMIFKIDDSTNNMNSMNNYSNDTFSNNISNIESNTNTENDPFGER